MENCGSEEEKRHRYVAEDQKPVQGSEKERNGQNEKEKMILAVTFWVDRKGHRCEWGRQWQPSQWEVMGAWPRFWQRGQIKRD